MEGMGTGNQTKPLTAQTQFPIPKMMLVYATSEQASSVAPVLMELNDTQSIQQWDHRSFLIRWGANSGRSVHFLAEEFAAELLEQFVCFHTGCFRQMD